MLYYDVIIKVNTKYLKIPFFVIVISVVTQSKTNSYSLCYVAAFCCFLCITCEKRCS